MLFTEAYKVLKFLDYFLVKWCTNTIINGSHSDIQNGQAEIESNSETTTTTTKIQTKSTRLKVILM